VRATVNGIVTNLDLHPGDYLAIGTQALAGALWVLDAVYDRNAEQIALAVGAAAEP
jgi:multidrug resistance efflux pump